MVEPAALIPLLLFLAPGFITLLIVQQLRGSGKAIGEFRASVLSVSLSAIMAIIFFARNELRTFDEAMGRLIASPVASLVEISVYVLIFSVILAVLMIFDPLHRIGKLLHGPRRLRPVPVPLWDALMPVYYLHPVEVALRSGEVYKGFLLGFSLEDERRAIHLSPAYEIGYDDAGNPDQVDLGEHLILVDDDILSIVVLPGERATVPGRAPGRVRSLWLRMRGKEHS